MINKTRMAEQRRGRDSPDSKAANHTRRTRLRWAARVVSLGWPGVTKEGRGKKATQINSYLRCRFMTVVIQGQDSAALTLALTARLTTDLHVDSFQNVSFSSLSNFISRQELHFFLDVEENEYPGS